MPTPRLSLGRADVAQRPGTIEAVEGAAAGLAAAGAADGALRWLYRALAIDPKRARAEAGLARAHQRTGGRSEAERRWRRALALDPGQLEAMGHAALGLNERGDPTGAIPWLHRAAALAPGWLAPHANLGDILRHRKAFRGARRAYRRSLALAPAFPQIWSNLALVEQAVLRSRETEAYLLRALAIQHHPAVHGNLVFARSYRPDVDERALFATVRSWAVRLAPRPRPPVRAAPGGPLRVGYLSADLRSHPVGWNLIGLLEHHDPRAVEIHAYSAVANPDQMTERFKAAFKGRWRDILQLSETAGAAAIAGDGIDILVVVAGHTEGNRPGIAAHRPAPVQVAIHDLTSTGLDTIDYWLTDVRLHPAPSHEIFSETLVRLPSLYLHAPPSEQSFEPRRGDGAGPVTFGSANNPAKLSGDVLGLWARILRDVPQSRLLLRYFDHFAFEDGREPIIEELARHGVSRERIQFDTGRRERVDQLRHLAAVDIALDPFPFNGATSTFEALWMGVPVVALAGQRFLGRVGAAHLGILGLDNLVATSPDEYVRIAVALAQDPARRSELHRTIPERLRASPLCDAPAYARTIEAAFRKMWDAALAGTRWDGWSPGQ